MSFIEQALNVPNLKPSRRAVLLKLAQYADTFGVACPSIPRIARETDISERTLFRILGELEKRGLISRKPSETYRSNEYTLHLDPCQIGTEPCQIGTEPCQIGTEPCQIGTPRTPDKVAETPVSVAVTPDKLAGTPAKMAPNFQLLATSYELTLPSEENPLRGYTRDTRAREEVQPQLELEVDEPLDLTKIFSIGYPKRKDSKPVAPAPGFEDDDPQPKPKPKRSRRQPEDSGSGTPGFEREDREAPVVGRTKPAKPVEQWGTWHLRTYLERLTQEKLPGLSDQIPVSWATKDLKHWLDDGVAPEVIKETIDRFFQSPDNYRRSEQLVWHRFKTFFRTEHVRVVAARERENYTTEGSIWDNNRNARAFLEAARAH